jgi:hypothetical protein
MDSNRQKQAGTRLRAALVLACLASVLAAPALAQGWWPWSTPTPVPREPMQRPQPYPQPGGPPGQAFPGQPYQPPGQPFAGSRPPICLQLEQRLAQDANQNAQAREVLPRLENDIRQAAFAQQTTQQQLDRGNCFEWFLFAKSLRQTRQCVDFNNQNEIAKRRLAELGAQRQQILSSGNRSFRDDIIRELARNGCGASYQQEARRFNNPFASIWQDDDSGGVSGGQFGTLPYATYRTICVRLCDGYYFPVSFSTLPAHFDRDAEACQSRCAAPAELYYHQNPGGAVEQAVSFRGQQAYTSLKQAFRYRKEFVQGCSCKQGEYVPQDAPQQTRDRRAEAGQSPVATQPRRQGN